MAGAEDLRSKEAQKKITDAIKEAELNTSGEIRVHVESTCKGDPCLRAAYIFTRLKMHQTGQRNGVLIYIAYSSRHFAIIGDSGINEKVGEGFWNGVKEQMASDFSQGDFIGGVSKAVLSAGEKLKTYFPYQKDDINEQSDEVSYGE